MSTSIADDSQPAVREDFGNYRILSRPAIIAAVLILPALLATALSFGIVWLNLGAAYTVVLPLPLVGVVLSVVALSSIRRYPKEYAGGPLAMAALVAHVALLAVSIPTHIYIQATEVPDGYRAISFSELQPVRRSCK